MTRGQKKTVRKALRRYGRGACEATPEAWREVVEETLAYYDQADPVCARLLRLRYLEDQPEERVIPELYVCRTTYYRKELGAAVNFAAANRGWMHEHPAFLCCPKVRSIFALRFVIG